uniref:Enoyl-CoA hydratase/carnithine racemase n=1 Tax=Candidatus Kentrum sp. UNK TaxID=2126344 RepID=A0A450ZYA5_9GAMM|nr:MAG: Enoyl-CoA hydratase/carnithine racemase [Candidatus Kentron sp. UNK]VFK68569.1 MAG: Enoyl-CoA hydratase/carnithine racemase [Candidatus Kentron sp. UNK]
MKETPEYPLDVLYRGGLKESFFDAICSGSANTYNEIWYHEENEVGYLAFDFYNGAMDTEKCHRLRDAFIAAKKRPTKVIVLSCGMDFWSNGIHLNVIEAAEDSAEEAWRNINAIDDLIHAIITTDTRLVISAMLGSAAAGGLIMALAADRIYAHHGIILNPHYKTMGLYGSEYWTYLLPRRVGSQKALELTENCLPITTEEADEILLIDGIIYSDGYDFYRHVARLAEHLANAPDYDMQIRLKAEQRRLDEEKKPLAAYREEELAEMKKCFYDRNHVYPQCGVDFHTARRNFVYNVRPAATPLRLARHRGGVSPTV